MIYKAAYTEYKVLPFLGALADRENNKKSKFFKSNVY